MNDLEMYLSLAVTVIGLIVSSITLLTKFLKSAKARKIAEQMLAVTNEILPLIENAEKFVHYSGVEKKEYVMTKVIQLAIEKRMKVDYELISEKVEELISLTNNVNTNKGNIELQKILSGRT